MHRVCVCLNHACVCACVRVSAAVRIHTRTHTNITNVCRIDVRTVWQYGSTAVSQQCFIWQYGSISSPQYGSMAVSQQCLSSISTMLHMAVRQYLITTIFGSMAVSQQCFKYLNNASACMHVCAYTCTLYTGVHIHIINIHKWCVRGPAMTLHIRMHADATACMRVCTTHIHTHTCTHALDKRIGGDVVIYVGTYTLGHLHVHIHVG